jgi:dienelactone hydrolase
MFAGILAYKEALEKSGITHEIFVYDGAQHAFNNDTSDARYGSKRRSQAHAQPRAAATTTDLARVDRVVLPGTASGTRYALSRMIEHRSGGTYR